MISRAISRLLVSLALGAILFPGALMAQSIPSPYRFLEHRQEPDLFAGYISPGTGRFGFGPGPGPVWGARYGLNLSGPFGLEGVVSHSPSTRDIVDPGRAEGDRVVGEMSSQLVMIEARLRFSLTGDRDWHGLAPFLITGGGFVFDVSNDQSDEPLILTDDRFKFGTSFLGMLGGGIRWFPLDRFFVRADAALVLWRLKTPQGYSDPERAFRGVDEKEWVSGPSYTLGIGYRF